MKLVSVRADPSVQITRLPGSLDGRISSALVMEFKVVAETQDEADWLLTQPASRDLIEEIASRLRGSASGPDGSCSPSIVVAIRHRVDGAASTALEIPAGTTETMLVHTDHGPLPLEVRANLVQ